MPNWCRVDICCFRAFCLTLKAYETYHSPFESYFLRTDLLESESHLAVESCDFPSFLNIFLLGNFAINVRF